MTLESRRLGRIALILLVNLAVTAVLVEASVRVAARMSPRIRTLLYVPELSTGAEYAHLETLPELVDACPCKFFGPYYDSFGYILNSRSLRTHEYETAKAPETRRVVLLGDSFLFDNAGAPDPLHIATVLARMLEEHGSHEVINLSLPCVGPRFSLRMQEIEASRLDPDVVVFGLFVGNDFVDEAVEARDRSVDVKLAVLSYAYRLARNWLRLRGGQRSVAIEPTPSGQQSERAERATPSQQRGGYDAGFRGPWPPDAPPIAAPEFHRIQMNKYAIFETGWDPFLKRQWRSVRKTLTRMHELAEEGGARFVLLVIPDENQLSPILQEQMRATFPDKSFDFAKPQQLVAAFAERRGIETIDLLPSFLEAAAAGAQLFATQDTHWGPEGQRVAAELIAERIRPAD